MGKIKEVKKASSLLNNNNDEEDIRDARDA